MARDDDFSAATKRLIAQRAGYVCAFPNCLAPTSGPAVDDNRAVNVGEAAHITAASENGPRYDATLTSEQRQDADNGIWMCSTHATLIDRDVDRYPTELLLEWKSASEDRAMKMLGQPKGCSQGKIATVSPATQLGADCRVLVDSQPIPHAPIVNPDDEGERMTWYVSAFVIHFSIQKKANLSNAVLDHLVVTVHETKPIPRYQPLFGAYPAEVSLFYVELEANKGTTPREFLPTFYYTQATDDTPEVQHYPQPIVLDDNVPAQIALRFNAKDSGMYLISTDAVVSSGDEREKLPVMPPQWVIFERDEPSHDEGRSDSAGTGEDLRQTYNSLDQNLTGELQGKSTEKEETYTLYRVCKDSIESLDIVCYGWQEVRRTYFERAQITNEVLLACHDGKVLQIQTCGGMVGCSNVQKWEPRDESMKCGKRVVIIEEGSMKGRLSIPLSQAAVIASLVFRDAIRKLIDGDASGHPYFRLLPANADCSMLEKYWRLAVEFPRESLPCIVIMNSNIWRSFPLPMTVEEAIQLVQEHLG